MEMLKYIIFFTVFFISIPTLTLVFLSQPKWQRWGFALTIFSIPFIDLAGINFFGNESYRGTSRGYEITLTVILTWSLLLSMLLNRKHKLILTPPGIWIFLLYILFSFISIINVDSYLYFGYEFFKMIIIFIFFITAYNYIIQTRDIDVILKSLACLIIYNLMWMLYQKYPMNIWQPSGLFAHRNSTAMFINLIGPIFLSYILNAKTTRKEFYLYFFAYICSALSVAMALSRASIALFPVSTAVVFFFSFSYRISMQKVKVLLLCLIIGTLGIIKAADMVVERFETASPASAETRIYLANIACNVANAYFFGGGLNNWNIKTTYPYTYNHVEGFDTLEEDANPGIVETIYLLVAAECGWITLIILLIWFIYYFYTNLLNIWRYKNTGILYMPIGIAGGLLAIYLQSTLEWVLKQTPNFYELVLIFAIISVMNQVYKDHNKEKTLTA